MVADNVFYVCVHVCMQAFMYSLPSFAAVLLYATIAAVTEAAVKSQARSSHNSAAIQTFLL